MSIVLASASPRRAELLRAAGFPFEVHPVDIDESRTAGESAETYVARIAAAKADAARPAQPDSIVIAADTIVVVDGDVFGKPADGRAAAAMLRRLSGRTHEVLTGVVVAAGSRREAFIERTWVWMKTLTDVEIDWYVGTGEPMDKAGAYAVQGLGSRFIPRIEGSYANVVGLPIARVSATLLDLAAGV